MLGGLSDRLGDGGRVLIFPEGVTHADSEVKRVRSGAARMLLAARRKAAAEGLAEPQLVPIGLHYSESQTFRERAAVVIERAMDLPPIPAIIEDVRRARRTGSPLGERSNRSHRSGTEASQSFNDVMAGANHDLERTQFGLCGKTETFRRFVGQTKLCMNQFSVLAG